MTHPIRKVWVPKNLDFPTRKVESKSDEQVMKTIKEGFWCKVGFSGSADTILAVRLPFVCVF